MESLTASNGANHTPPMSDLVRQCPKNPGSHRKPAPLSDRQQRAIELMLQGLPDSRIAQTLGFDPRTLYRWRRQPVFASELDRRRHRLRKTVNDRLVALLPEAVDVLKKQLSDPYDRTAYRAASLLVRTAFRKTRTGSIDKRVRCARD
jgi:hypothetical protein